VLGRGLWQTDCSRNYQERFFAQKNKEPHFEIEFPDKAGQKWFVGFDLNYVMSYSEEVPLRYHKLKAERIMKGAKQAEQAMLKAASSPQNFNEADEDSETESETAVEIRKAVAENNMDLKMPARTIVTRPTADDAELVDAEGNDISHFNPDLWRPNVLPDMNDIPFLGKSGPQHTLSPATATPFEYFCLFIPIKGRCSFKQYIKSKPVRWGLKIFCVCCSLTGYLWNATIYIGKNNTDEDKKKEISSTHFLVKIELRSRKFWHPLFWFIIEAVLINAWLL